MIALVGEIPATSPAAPAAAAATCVPCPSSSASPVAGPATADDAAGTLPASSDSRIHSGIQDGDRARRRRERTAAGIGRCVVRSGAVGASTQVPAIDVCATGVFSCAATMPGRPLSAAA